MTCSVSEERLWSWLDRQAPELESHLRTCSTCRLLVEQYRAGITAVAAGSTPRRPSLPQRIGSYEIVGLLGEGAQGLVCEAKQQTLGRPVALKVVKSGHFVGEQDVRLFQREIQTLARLKHPCIAAIYEAGSTEQGHHFFAMELVRGAPLTAYVARRELPQNQRLELFRRICEGIHYAHQRGVIHRDMKPGHVLVEADGSPKILDFGLARMIDPQDRDGTVSTRVGGIQGTLPYMSPEQVRGRPDEIDVRTDVYSLGVILYELLTGRLPYDVSSTTPHGAIEVICEQTPQRPGTIDRSIRGDVETIVLKALEKEPARRYQSALALAEDVSRYLAGQPILARPTSTVYQLRKLVARHKLASALAATLFVLMPVTAIWVSVLYAQARAETRKATLISTVLQDIWVLSNPMSAEGRPVDIHQILDEAAKRIETDLKIYPEVEAAQRTAIGNTYLGLGQYDKASRHLWRAMGIRQRIYGEKHPDHPDIATSEHNLAALLFAKGDYDGAKRRYYEALSMRRRLFGPEHPQIAGTLNGLAMLLQAEGDYDAAEDFYQEALAMNRKLLGAEHPAVATTLNNMATLFRDKGDYDSAEALFAEALVMRRKLLGEQHLQVATTLDDLAKLHHARGQYDQAEQEYGTALDMRRTLPGGQHPYVAVSLNNLGRLLEDRQDFAGAESHYREALALRRDLLGDAHPATLASVNRLAALLRRLGRLDEAESLYLTSVETRRSLLEVLDTRRRVLPDRDSGLAAALLTLATVRMDLGNPKDAEPLLIECQDVCRHAFPEPKLLIARTISARGRCLLLLGRTEEAEPLLIEGLTLLSDDRATAGEPADKTLDLIVDLCVARSDPEHGRDGVLTRVLDLALSLRDEGEAAGAAMLLRRALTMGQGIYGNEHKTVADIQHSLGEVLEDAGDYQASERHYLQASSVRRTLLGDEHPETVASTKRLAGVLRAQNRLDDAERLYGRILDSRRASRPEGHLDIASSLMPLAVVRVEKGDPGKAEPLLRECLDIRNEALGKDHWLTANARSALGGCLVGLGRFAEAEQLLLAGYEGLAKELGQTHARTAEALDRLVVLYNTLGKPELAAVYRTKLDRSMDESETVAP